MISAEEYDTTQSLRKNLMICIFLNLCCFMIQCNISLCSSAPLILVYTLEVTNNFYRLTTNKINPTYCNVSDWICSSLIRMKLVIWSFCILSKSCILNVRNILSQFLRFPKKNLINFCITIDLKQLFNTKRVSIFV